VTHSTCQAASAAQYRARTDIQYRFHQESETKSEYTNFFYESARIRLLTGY